MFSWCRSSGETHTHGGADALYNALSEYLHLFSVAAAQAFPSQNECHVINIIS